MSIQFLSLHRYGGDFVGFGICGFCCFVLCCFWFGFFFFPLVNFSQTQEIQPDFALYFMKCDLSVSSAF